MEQMTKQYAMNQLVDAYKALEVAKEDCKTVVDATFDAYSIIPENLTEEEWKKFKVDRKTEKKNIIKLAKAMMKGEKEAAKEEAENMASLIEELG